MQTLQNYFCIHIKEHITSKLWNNNNVQSFVNLKDVENFAYFLFHIETLELLV
jgi:hypothetical protein